MSRFDEEPDALDMDNFCRMCGSYVPDPWPLLAPVMCNACADAQYADVRPEGDRR